MSDRRCDGLAMQMSEHLDRVRAARDVSVYRLAKTTRFSENTISFVLDGRTCRTSTLDRLAAALGCRWVVRLEPMERSHG